MTNILLREKDLKFFHLEFLWMSYTAWNCFFLSSVLLNKRKLLFAFPFLFSSVHLVFSLTSTFSLWRFRVSYAEHMQRLLVFWIAHVSIPMNFLFNRLLDVWQNIHIAQCLTWEPFILVVKIIRSISWTSKLLGTHPRSLIRDQKT